MYYKATVRYGQMGFVKDFATEIGTLRRGDRVVVRTDRGSEVGLVIEAPGESSEERPSCDGEVLRRLTEKDEEELERIERELVPGEMKFCRERIKALSLGMKLVRVEHLLGGEKIIFYFLADGRVDFRQLVKDLAREYKTRIELRQIGVRDEARLLAEVGHCGRRLCCRSFIKSLEPVTMRMAKSQKATLDPSKISGICGRLMCCLRYEDGLYRRLKSNLPKKGSHVETEHFSGKVVGTEILSQTVTLRTSASNTVDVDVDDINHVQPRERKSSKKDSKSASGSAKSPGPRGRKEGAGGGGRPKGSGKPGGPQKSAGKGGGSEDSAGSGGGRSQGSGGSGGGSQGSGGSGGGRPEDSGGAGSGKSGGNGGARGPSGDSPKDSGAGGSGSEEGGRGG